MFTLSFIKRCSKTFSADGIRCCKEYANIRHDLGAWWAFDCITMYQYFLESMDKLFWWSMVVKALRYANYYVRKEQELK